MFLKDYNIGIEILNPVKTKSGNLASLKQLSPVGYYE